MSPKAFKLMQKHQQLDSELRLQQARRVPDGKRIAQLKKLKLAVKDRLHALINRTRPHTAT
ncbi:MAG: hypothetical protein B7Z33_02710 [Sphingomonadales bacterium 12-68-11]|nr:MAG: hypothetical protein B7Z33_02710 [Sphingomonadales bacterium 12-68-11]OYX16081.1 MAG: hypothetical protein B7Z07_03355 [Sphingomonadales bacterium 32-67-7]